MYVWKNIKMSYALHIVIADSLLLPAAFFAALFHLYTFIWCHFIFFSALLCNQTKKSYFRALSQWLILHFGLKITKSSTREIYRISLVWVKISVLIFFFLWHSISKKKDLPNQWFLRALKTFVWLQVLNINLGYFMCISYSPVCIMILSPFVLA